MKVVVDTNVLISGLLTPHGPPAEIVRMVLNGNLRVCYDLRILDEYSEVFARPKFDISHGLSANLSEQIRASGDSGGKSTSQHSQEGRISSMTLLTVASRLEGKPSIDRFRPGLEWQTTHSGSGLIGVFPVRNLTDVLLLDYVLSFPSDF